MSHWFSGLPVCFPSWGTRVQPRGVLMWNRDSPVSVVLLHWWLWRDWSLWPRLRWASSRTVNRPSCWQCDNPTWSYTALLSWFHARCRSSFQLHNRHIRLRGGGGLALWRAYNLTAFTPCLTGPVDYLLASRHEGPGFNSQGLPMRNRDSPLSAVWLHYTHNCFNVKTVQSFMSNSFVEGIFNLVIHMTSFLLFLISMTDWTFQNRIFSSQK
jgi:hypothetical protein